MPKKKAVSSPASPDRYFVKELAGETPPSFSALERLYGLASELYGLHPWRLLDESNLIVVQDSIGGETFYCSVMGSHGEVFSMHAYIGAEGLRQFRKIEAEAVADPGEFLASMHCVYVEFVPRKELLRQDRELLATLGHPTGRGLASPVFRTIRPGYHPWFVTEEEARMLAECIRAVIAVSATVVKQEGAKFWDETDTYPMVKRLEGVEPRYKVELVKPMLPAEPPSPPARLEEEALRQLRSQDYAVRGAMELDHLVSAAPVGKPNERKSCAAISLAVDAESGMILAPEINKAGVEAGDAVARVFFKAVQANRALPKEVRVRSQKLKDSLVPLMDSFGVSIRVLSRLPGADRARAHLLSYIQGD